MICPYCGTEFEPTDHRQAYCLPSHRRAQHKLNEIRGDVALPFLLAWRAGKRGKSEDSVYALQQLSMLADRWRAEDRVAGRRSDLIVSRKRIAGWRCVDLG